MPWTDDDIRKAAKEQYHEDGSVEIDDDAVVSRGEEMDGAYVQAWVWVATPKPQASET